MARSSSTAPGRLPARLRGLALASCTALAVTGVTLAGATPALAQTSGTTTTSTSGAGAASAASVRLVLNLPQGQSVSLEIDPVAGTVRSVAGSGPEADALAAVLAGSAGGQSQSFGLAEAKLPTPLTATGSPLDALNSGINGSPLGAFLSLNAATSTAAVTPSPNATSQAGTSLGVGLPQAVADGLQALFTPLIAGIQTVLLTLPTGTVLPAVCGQLAPVTGGIGTVPVVGTLVNQQQVDAVCAVNQTLMNVVAALGASLETLGGPGGLLNLGLLQSSQSVTTDAGKVTSTATSQVGQLGVLGGVNPFGAAQVLRTASTAATAGTPGSATATVDEAAVTLGVQQLALLNYVLPSGLSGQVAGVNLAGLSAILDQLQTLLAALAGIGVEGGRIGAPTDAIAACPDALSPTLSGTFKAPDGTCATAAARGYGLALTLPAPLAGPLGITGPLVQLTFAPSAAVARTTVTSTTTPTTPPQPAKPGLARTGLEGPGAAAGLLLLVLAGAVRRRRALA